MPYQAFYTFRTPSRVATFYRATEQDAIPADSEMPSFPRRVAFKSTESAIRPGRDNELHAMYNYARHASHCERCRDAYQTHRAGKSICDRGHQHARAVAKLLYSEGGRPYSTTDSEDVEVEIPLAYEPTRKLLRALEKGLRLGRSNTTIGATAPPAPPSKAVISYGRHPAVDERPSTRRVVQLSRTASSNSKTTTTTAAAAAPKKPSRPKVEIVEPPRGSSRDDRKVIYVNRDGTVYRPTERYFDNNDDGDDDDEAEIIVYASPHSTSSYYAQEDVYR